MAKVIVYHRGYGCDTGCCGHVVEVFDDEVVAREGFDPYWSGGPYWSGRREHFSFTHPDDDLDEAGKIAWAREFVRATLGEEHVADLDWDHCIVSDD